MQDAPGYNCGCGDTLESNSKVETEDHNGEACEQDDGEEVCNQCKTALEWRLNLDGTTTLECPHC
jgi:hypothetical protein